MADDKSTTNSFAENNVEIEQLTAKHPLKENGEAARRSALSEQELSLLVGQTRPSNAAKQRLRSERRALSDPTREALWKTLCRRLLAYESQWQQAIELYREQVPGLFGQDAENLRDVPLPAFVDSRLMPTYFLNSNGRNKLKKIVCVIGFLQPEITHSPYLYPLVAVMLHYISDDAECYACVDAMLHPRQKAIRRLYMSETRGAWLASADVVRHLLLKRVKSTRTFVQSMPDDDKRLELFDGWVGYIFGDLPFDYIVALLDCFFYEGVKVLFRAALALFKLYLRREIASGARTTSAKALGEGMHEFCRNIRDHYSIAQFLRVGFAIPRLSQHEIAKMLSDAREERNGAVVGGAQPADMAIKGNASSWTIKALDTENDLQNRSAISDRMALQPTSSLTGVELPESRIIEQKSFFTVWNWLPARHQLFTPKLLFTTHEDGLSMVTFWEKISQTEASILIVKTTAGDVFGAFCASSWQERFDKGPRAYFGTGETFVFTLLPRKERFAWVGEQSPPPQPPTPQQPSSDDGEAMAPQTTTVVKKRYTSMFMAGGPGSIAIGGGSGQAIRFDGNFERGRTEACDTFGNAPLASETDFDVRVFEAYGFESL